MNKILFIHHSVGRLLLEYGNVRESVSVGGKGQWELWDYDYNRFGLKDGTGETAECGWKVPNDDTDPNGLHKLIASVVNNLDGLGIIKDYDALMLKSCYTASSIKTDETLSVYEDQLDNIVRLSKELPLKVIFLTSPPRTSFATRYSDAVRANEYRKYILNHDHDNGGRFRVIDLFGFLTSNSDKYTLDPQYRRFFPLDSHPNKLGSKMAGDFISKDLIQILAE